MDFGAVIQRLKQKTGAVSTGQVSTVGAGFSIPSHISAWHPSNLNTEHVACHEHRWWRREQDNGSPASLGDGQRDHEARHHQGLTVHRAGCRFVLSMWCFAQGGF